jgi:hypothetical protein
VAILVIDQKNIYSSGEYDWLEAGHPRKLGSILDVCLSMHRCICVEKKNRLDVTECFIALIIHSTRFGHFYAHHQELETICVLLPPMVCSALLLVVGDQVQGNRLCIQEDGCCIPLHGLTACCPELTPDNQQTSTAHYRL